MNADGAAHSTIALDHDIGLSGSRLAAQVGEQLLRLRIGGVERQQLFGPRLCLRVLLSLGIEDSQRVAGRRVEWIELLRLQSDLDEWTRSRSIKHH